MTECKRHLITSHGYKLTGDKYTKEETQGNYGVVKGFFAGVLSLTGAVGALWRAGWCLAIRATAELLVVTG